jgi:hypothetical protein
MNNQSSIMWTQLIHYLFMLTHTPVSSFTSLTIPMFISSSYMYQDLVNYSETRWQERSMNNLTKYPRQIFLLVQQLQLGISKHLGLEVHHSFLGQPIPAEARIQVIKHVHTKPKKDAAYYSILAIFT